MSQVQPTRIVGAVLDTTELVLWKADGTTITIKQGDPRLRKIVEEAVPAIQANGYYDLDSEDSFAKPVDRSFEEIEQKSNGFVRFFRVAKKKLSKFFSDTEAKEEKPLPDDLEVGTFPVATQSDTKVEIEAKISMPPSPAAEKMASAVAEIMQHAVPASDPKFHEGDVAKQAPIIDDDGKTPGKHVEETAKDTVIAVVDGKVIPGMEKIANQFQRAAKLGSTTAVENFLKRLASVIDQRKHSIDDLLKFLERADLPIAEDGSLIIYKVLNKRGNKYRDVHSGNVEQFIGAYVCMDISLVDHDRRNECSNGLHVARRGYVSGFSGDVCVLAKLAPEDVIAVPQYDANKMRVCGYHILAELSDAQYRLIRQNRPITEDEDGKKLLASVMAGRHVARTHEVRITGHKGAGVITTPLTVVKQEKPAKTTPAEALADALPDSQTKDAPVDVKAVVKQVTALSRKDQAQALYKALSEADGEEATQKALDALHAFKKAAKVGWDKLGLPEINGPVISLKKAKVQEKPVKADAKTVPQPKVPASKSAPEPMLKGKVLKSPREEVQHLLPQFINATGAAKREFANDLMKVKRASKKSWEVLGVNETQAASIKLQSND